MNKVDFSGGSRRGVRTFRGGRRSVRRVSPCVRHARASWRTTERRPPVSIGIDDAPLSTTVSIASISPSLTAWTFHVKQRTRRRHAAGQGGAAGDRDPQRRPDDAAPAAPPGLRGRQPEGRGRQDHHHGEHRRRAGAGRAARADHRSRPAGQRVDRARCATATAGTPSVYDVLLGEITAGRGDPDLPGRPAARLHPGHDRPGRRRDRTGLAGRRGRPG